MKCPSPQSPERIAAEWRVISQDAAGWQKDRIALGHRFIPHSNDAG